MKIKEELENKIISVAFGTGNIFDKIHIKLLAKKYPEVKKLYCEYKATAKAIRKIELQKCPDEIIQRTKQIIKPEERKIKFFINPKFAFTIAIIVLMFVTFLFLNQKEEIKFTNEEIYSAYSDAEESLTLIAEVFGDSKKTIEEEILGEELGKPFSNGINSINTIMFEQSELLKK